MLRATGSRQWRSFNDFQMTSATSCRASILLAQYDECYRLVKAKGDSAWKTLNVLIYTANGRFEKI